MKALDYGYLLAGWWQLVRVLGQHSEVINNSLEVRHLSQHGDLHILREEGQGGMN